LGILDQQVWGRPAEELGKRHARKQRPIREKESQKWLTSLKATAAAQQHLPHSRLVSVGDREADIYDLFLEAQALEQEVLVRAAWDRGVAHPEGHLWAYLGSRPVAGTATITVPRQPGQPARTAELTVRHALVTLRPPRHRRQDHLPPITVWAVLAREEIPPAGTEAIEWLLLTTVPVQTFEDACQRVQWYTCRWIIEIYHKVLKSGCRVEQRQFEYADRLVRYLALDSVIAWRVLFLTLVGRELPAMPCTAILEADEWQALYCFIHKTNTPPLEPPTLQQATRWIAQLGGCLARKHDGEPGPTVIWRGLQRLNDLAMAWQLFHPCAASP
jgi:Transposase Tn5 dimerisation domain